MTNDKVFQMNFGKIYGLLLDKATRKGRTKAEVDGVGGRLFRRPLLWGLLPQRSPSQSEPDID